MFLSPPEREKLLSGHKQTLHNAVNNEHSPGSILHDFDVMLDMFKGGGLGVTASGQLAMSAISVINARLAHPLDVKLKRPQQKSYPPILGLYLLVRASGLTRIDETGKKPLLVLEPDMFSQWQNLNPTERFCTLLEAWFLRGRPEILGEPPRYIDM